MVSESGPEDATEAALTMGAEPHAYEFEAFNEEDWQPPRSPRSNWIVAVAAVVAAVAAVAGSVAVGVHTWRSDEALKTQPPVEVGEYRSPALLHPDQDTAFLQDLDRTGTIYDSAGVAIHNARLVCKMLAAGRTADAIAADFTRAAETQPGKSEVFVSIAIQHYCPTQPPI